MKLTKKRVLVGLATLAMLGTYVALDTRLGVHLMLDVLPELGKKPEVQTHATDGPLRLTAQLAPAATIALPSRIEQASGIKHRGGRVYIATDQTEIFELDSDYREVSAGTELIGGPLLFKQGSLEGIEVAGDTLVGAGEFGALPRWVKQADGRWKRVGDVPVPAALASMELSGITDTPQSRLAVSEDHAAILDLGDGSTRLLEYGSFLRDNANLASLKFSGIAYADERLYILSESHTMIIVARFPGLEVESVFGIEACAAADLSVHGGRAYVVVDHNYGQAVEPIRVFDLPAATQGGTTDAE